MKSPDFLTHKIPPPKNDELEVTVFGKGIGESIVVHLGDNEWMIVDSFLDPTTKKPIALEYLKSLGLNPKDVVKKFVVTHWHDDHIQGAADIVGECENAQLVCANALTQNSFAKLFELQKSHRVIEGSEGTGGDEWGKVLQILKSRPRPLAIPQYAFPNGPIWIKPSSGINCKVHTLSPSNVEFHRSLLCIQRLYPKPGESKKRIPYIKDNDVSVVLWVEFNGYFRILLGADLEMLSVVDRGWNAILNSGLRPSGRASVYKVAHHGSRSSYSDKIWTLLLKDDPYGILTPYNPSKIPNTKGIEKILQWTVNGYSAAGNSLKKINRPDPMVEKTLKEGNIQCRVIENNLGGIQVRHHLASRATSHSILGSGINLKAY